MDRYKISNLKAFNVRRPRRYDSSFWVRFWTGQWDQEILSELPQDICSLCILDVGCATGRLLSSLAKAGAASLAGADLAPRILDVARHKLSEEGVSADLRVADVEKDLPWQESRFDIVTMTGVLHHFSRPTDALAQIHRVLRNRGRVFIIEPWLPTPLRQIVNLGLRFMPRDGDFHYYIPNETTQMLTSLGFTDSQHRRVAGHSFLVTCTKQL